MGLLALEKFCYVFISSKLGVTNYFSMKSTFAQALENHYPKFRRCNQDDLGDRRSVEVLARRSLQEGLSVCIDRGNFDERSVNFGAHPPAAADVLMHVACLIASERRGSISPMSSRRRLYGCWYLILLTRYGCRPCILQSYS